MSKKVYVDFDFQNNKIVGLPVATSPDQPVIKSQLDLIQSISMWSVSGVVDFGSYGDYVELTIPTSASHVANTKFLVSLSAYSPDHPAGDEVVLEELLTTVKSEVVGTSVTVAVYAPNSTWGRYNVSVVGISFV